MTLHLYELSPAIKQLLELMEEEGTDWTASLDELEGLFADKAVALAKLFKTWEAQERVYKTEIERLEGHKKAAQGKQAWAKQYLKGNMEDAGIDHVPGDVVDIKLQNGAPSVIVEDETEIPDAYYTGTLQLPWAQVKSRKLEAKADKVLDRRAILDAHSGEVGVPGIRVEKNTYIRIR
ncbi:hypothetical protein LCGC14_1356340 [marine sediment metagenome]|uniref:Siphovirus Gp157 family protein n=1 Tax=marine sediment metagenome TaxID=412755 RepID=A0A0F9NBR3_9ZZZZ